MRVIPEIAAARGAPEFEEPMWPCVNLGGAETGAGWVIRARVLWLYTSPSNVWTLVQRVHQLQAEQVQAFCKLE